jgi:hypothetical protein
VELISIVHKLILVVVLPPLVLVVVEVVLSLQVLVVVEVEEVLSLQVLVPLLKDLLIFSLNQQFLI